ncbi:MAG TPA: MATE family efflux transporter [Burkholderiaceae bacterium]
MSSTASAPHPSAIRTEASALWRLAWPILTGQLATVGMSVADVAMTGHASAMELAAVSVGAAIWSIVSVTVIGIMMAINSLVAHEVGAGNHAAIPHLVRQSLWKALLIGLLACVFANCAVLVFDHIGLERDVRDKAAAFVHIISLGLPALAATRTLYGYSTSLNQTKPMMVVALGGLGYNIVMNWLLIYGHFGFPAMGGVGCAVATASGLWLMLGAMVYWIRRAPAYRSTYPFDRMEGPHLPEIRRMLHLGMPIGVSYFAEVSAFAIVGLLVARFGVVQMSAHQIALNFSSLVFMVPLTFGIALVTRVGHALGEGDPRRARFAAEVGLGLSLAFAVLSAIAILICRTQIAQAYTTDPQVQEMARHLLLFAAIFQLSDAAQVGAACAIRGYNVTRMPMVIHLAAFWLFAVPLGCLLGLAPGWAPLAPAVPMGAAGFWIGLVVGLTVAAVALCVYLDRLSRSRIG